MLYGFLNPFLYYIFIFKSYTLLPAQIAQPLNFTWPLVIVLFSILFFGEKAKWQVFVALFISFIGVIFISSEGKWLTLSFNEPLGIVLALSSSIIWASYWLLNRNDRRETIVKLFYNFLFATLYISIVFVLTHEIKIPSMNGLLASFYIGSFEMGIAFIFWMKALETAKNTQFISNLIYITPFLSLVLIYFVLNERIYYSSVAGLGLIVFGILIQSKTRRNHD
jgi:drug/metabolite transporter (DMT)-like permease